MDFDAPPENDAYRMQVRAWIDKNPNPNYKQLVDAGYVVPHWPKPYGLEAGPLEQLIIAEEMKRAGIKRPQNPIGIGWAGPTILEAEPKNKRINTYLAYSRERISGVNCSVNLIRAQT